LAGLDPNLKVPVGGLLGDCAHAIKQECLDWLGETGRRQPRPLDWWGSIIASRSPLQSDLFLCLSHLALLRSWIADMDNAPVRLAVIGDEAVWQTLSAHPTSLPSVRLVGSAASVTRWTRVMQTCRAVACPAYAAVWLVATRCVCLLLGLNKQPNLPVNTVLVYTWLENRLFAKDGTLSDAYTGRLEANLLRDGFAVTRLMALRASLFLTFKLRRFRHKVIVPAAFLRLRDVIDAVAPPRIDLDVIPLRCVGWNCLPLLRQHNRREHGHPAIAFNRLWYRAMCRLAKSQGERVSGLIYTFENHAHEKMMCLAWHEWSDKTRIVGYQHSTISPLMLGYSLGCAEATFHPLPDTIAVTGEANAALLKSSGFAHQKMSVAGALRYEHLSALRPRSPSAPGDRNRRIVVALPISRKYAGECVSGVLCELSRPLQYDGVSVEFCLKFHPWLPASAVIGKRRLPPGVKVCEEPLPQLLASASALLYAPPTAAWWEAYLHGIPVLKFLGDFLDIDSDKVVPGVAVPVCTQSTLRQAVLNLLAAGPPPTGNLNAIRDQLFAPVNEAAWREMLQPCPN